MIAALAIVVGLATIWLCLIPVVAFFGRDRRARWEAFVFVTVWVWFACVPFGIAAGVADKDRYTVGGVFGVTGFVLVAFVVLMLIFVGASRLRRPGPE